MSHTSDDDDDLTIPDFLRVTGPRPWKPPVLPAAAKAYVDPKDAHQRELADNIKARRAAALKEKNRRGFELMQAKHPDERYDRKRKIWVPK